MFERTCNFQLVKDDLDPEELEFEFIDFGVEEVFIDQDDIFLYASFENFGDIQGELEKRNIEILSSNFERIPKVLKKLNSDQKQDIEKLIERIEEDDDVQNVYHSMDIS